MQLAIGCDHAGVALKDEIKRFLADRGHAQEDFGTFDERSVDYPDYAQSVGEAVAAGRAERGILVCGTGIGVSISANKIHGIRAAVCSDTFSARMSREHNDANVLCVGARVVGVGLALDIVAAWLDAKFAGGRHVRRIEKIATLDAARRGVAPTRP